METPIKIKRTAITLAQKVQIILKLNDPSFKQKEIAQEYGLTASAISKIVKKKEGILEEWLRGGNLERKRKREGKNQTIDDALLSWFWMASKEEGPISGPVLMAKAKALADEMGIEFKPTNGWLCRWKNRNNLAYRRVPREKAEYRATGDQRTGLPMLVTPSLYLQDGQPGQECYGGGTPTQPLEEAEEDSHDQTAEGMEQEEQDSPFYTGATIFPPVSSVQRGQWQAAVAGSSDSSSDEMPAACPIEQQDVATQHKPKRIKQEGVPLQSGPSCQSYTAPLDLRSQQEMPGTSRETAATGIQSKVERVKTEENSRNYTYQFYKVPSGQQERQFISDSSDTSSDEASLTQPPIHQVASTHHPATQVKQEEGSQQLFYRGREKSPDQRHKPWLTDNQSDEIMKTKTPIYRTAAARSGHERILQEEESPSEGQHNQSTPYKGKQTLTQVLQQLGTQRPLRGLYNEFPGSFEMPEELSHNQYRAQRSEDSIFKRRNQFCKGENSYRRELAPAPKVPAGCMKKSELAATSLLRNVYFAAKEMIPNSSTEALNELCLIQGLGDLADQLSIYQRDKSIEEFQQAIAEVLEEGILRRARSCNCFSILIDQSEDCFAEPCLFLYLRIIEHVAGGYEPKTYLLAVKELQEEVTAEKITTGLTQVLKEKGLDLKLMCGLAIDGTAVSAECRGSVAAELRAQVPGLLSIRCIAHRLTLSCVSAADTVPYLVKYQQVLHSVYTHFAELPNGGDGLEAMQKVLSDRDKQSSPFRDIFPSRWLTVRASVEAVIRNFGRLIPLLRDGRSARGARLAKTLCTYKFLHCSHFLADVLHQLAILGKSYQSPDVDFSIVHPLLKSTVTTINKLGAGSTGETLKHLLAALPASACPPDGSFTFQSQLIKDGSRQRSEAESTCTAFLENLTQDLRARFSEAQDADTMTAMTAVFDPTHLSDSKTRHIQTLTDYLSSLGSQRDKDHFEMSCKQELISFMNFVESRPGVHTLTNARDVCQLALKQKLMFPVVGSLAERFLTLPIPTAQLKGLFNRQHTLRSRLGDSLTTTSLENLLKITMHGPPIKEFNFKAAYQQLAHQQS